MKLEPINQTKLYGLENYFNELINLYRNQKFPIKFYYLVQKSRKNDTCIPFSKFYFV